VACFPTFVDPSLPVKSVAELAALAKSEPGTLSFGYANALGQLSGRGIEAAGGHRLLRYLTGIVRRLLPT
jgi:hypothetical protein